MMSTVSCDSVYLQPQGKNGASAKFSAIEKG